MKKLVQLTIVACISSIITLGVIYLINPNVIKKEKEDTQAGNALPITQPTAFPSIQFSNQAPTATVSDNLDFVTAAQKSVHAVVHVNKFSERNVVTNSFEYFFGINGNYNDDPVRTGSGSGVIISSDGYVVTNNHVIEGADKIKVTLNDQRTYTAQVIGKDPNTDIALMKIKETDLPYLTLSDSDQIQLGEWVLAVGNPFNLTSTVTAGIISAKGRNIDLLSRSKNATNPIESFLQTDAAVNPGNSGGALVNINGDLIGINTAISSQTGAYVGYSFAVPSNLVKKVVEDLLEYGVVQRALLGVNIQNISQERIDLYNQYAREENLEELDVKPQEGVYITYLTDNGGALEAGLEKGDIIKKLDDKTTKNKAELMAYLGSKRPGDDVHVTILRENRLRTYKVKLKNRQGTIKRFTKSEIPLSTLLGATFEPLSNNERNHLGIEDYGVRVRTLERRGKLSQKGMKRGDVILKINGQKIRKEKDMKKIIDKQKNNKKGIYINAIDSYGLSKYIYIAFGLE